MTLGPHAIEHFSQPLPPDVRAYLNHRGIADNTIARFGLGWNGERITIPIWDRDGTLAFFRLATFLLFSAKSVLNDERRLHVCGDLLVL